MTYGFTNSAQNLAETSSQNNIPQPSNQKEMIEALFEQYKKEMLYLRNFSVRTLRGYQEVFNRWQKYIGQMPTELNLSMFVIAMRQAGLNTTTCNISIRAFNSFLTWLKEKGICPEKFSNGKPFKLDKLPEEKKQLRVFDDSDIHKILSFKPRKRNDHRIYALVCTLIDTGIRINECLNLERDRIDFDNLMIIVTKGKGKKERVVPMSLELRKILHRYLTNHRDCKFESNYLFCTVNGTPLSHRNAMRDFENMLKKVGVSKDNIDHCFHSFRRKFAKSYIKNGGNIAYLQHAMGHTTLAMTKHYIGDIEIEDLKLMHQKVGILAKLK
jgi:integrase/recombinase XerD